MMPSEDDDEVFLGASAILKYATLRPNLNDPFARERTFDDWSNEQALSRSRHTPGTKVMEEQEKALRRFDFIEAQHVKWAADFRELALDGVAEEALEIFISSFANLWVDGKTRRQASPEMMQIKRSIQEHDRKFHPKYAGAFVVNAIEDVVPSLFEPEEMAHIFSINERLLETRIPDYMDALGPAGPESINFLFVRRGVYMTQHCNFRTELNYLSSYSLSLGPVENFSQTWPVGSKVSGFPTIYSAPLPAVQQRVVAFAPFIAGMSLQQLEIVVAPPVEETPLLSLGEHGGIYEFVFD